MEVIEKYTINNEGCPFYIEILGKNKSAYEYKIYFMNLQQTTTSFIESIKDTLRMKLKTKTLEMIHQENFEEIKESIIEEIENLPAFNSLCGKDEEMKRYIRAKIIREMHGFGDIDILRSDTNLEEIVANGGKENIRIYHKIHGWLKTNLKFNEQQIINTAQKMGQVVGRSITSQTPVLDANLANGDRINAVLKPISKKGSSLTIRLFARKPWTVVDLIKNKTCTIELFALMWLVIHYEGSILISGGTASGKTSLANVILNFIPPKQRIVTIEQTSELKLPKHLHWVPLITRLPNPEGKGEISMLDLVVTSLRMRPDRIVMGEVRRKEEAEELFEALHTGHSVYATLHANDIESTIRRLVYPPINVSKILLDGIDLNVVMFRDRRKQIRRVAQIGEFILKIKDDKINIEPNILHAWDPMHDKMVKVAESRKIFENIKKTTGLSQSELDIEYKNKMLVMEWLIKNNETDVDKIGNIFKEYYDDPMALLKRIKGKNGKRKKKTA